MAEPWSSPTLGPYGAGPLDQLSPGPALQPSPASPFPHLDIWPYGALCILVVCCFKITPGHFLECLKN